MGKVWIHDDEGWVDDNGDVGPDNELSKGAKDGRNSVWSR